MYNVIVADPPWQFGDKLPGATRGAERNYDCMPVDEIQRFHLPPMGNDSVLFLWRVASMQREALNVMSAWGYTQKTELVWLKKTAYLNRWFGMGRIVRAEHEVCLIGTRGRPKVLSNSIRSVFAARVKAHSEKPDEFFEIVQSLYAGPYVELFARKRREGWTCFGKELA
jgi:N6-adenosine-specific RNA methylase IME4